MMNRGFWRSGDPLVWLAAGALVLCLMMLFGLIFLVGYRGLASFWPSQVVRFELVDGGAVAGEVTARERIPAPDDAGAPPRYRIQVKVGNRDRYGLDFRWIGEDEITIFDNQTETGAPPRALRLRIEGDTARVVELIEDETLTESPCCGSARRAEDGSWLISWGGTPLVSLVGPDGERRFALEFEPNVMSYRAVSAGAYDDVQRFRDGMSAQVPDAQ